MKGWCILRFNTYVLRIICISLLLPLITACQRESPIEIGVVGTLTGPNSDLSISGRRGIEIALEEINTSGGLLSRDVVIKTMDDKNDSEEALNAFEALTENDIHLAIGPFTSGMIIGNIEAVNAMDLLVLGPTISADNLSNLDDHFIRLIASTKEQAVVLAKQVEKDAISKCMIVFDQRNEGFTESLISHFEEQIVKELGITCTTLGINPQEESATNKMMNTFKFIKPEGVFIIASAEDVASFAQKLYLIDHQVIMYAPLWANTPELIKKGGKAVEHMRIVGAIDLKAASPAFSTFRETYIRHYGEEPTFASMYAYEAMKVLAEAIEKTKQLEPEKIKKYIIEKREYMGLQGTFEIDENGDNIRDYMLFENVDGKLRKVF